MAFLSTTEGWATRSFSLSRLSYLFWRKVHYTPGKTPLVGWIKGYMVPELLGIEVCQELQEQQPAEYGGMKTYLKKTYDRVDRMKKAELEKAKAEQEALMI